MSEIRATKRDGTVVDAAVVKRDGKDTLAEAIPAADHGQKRKMRGYDNPASHMHGWPVERRMDAWAFPLIEIMCKHGVGHPMPESVAWIEEHQAKPGSKGTWGVHGCCGCCFPPKEILTPSVDGNVSS